jgi:hypothetical protein
MPSQACSFERRDKEYGWVFLGGKVGDLLPGRDIEAFYSRNSISGRGKLLREKLPLAG